MHPSLSGCLLGVGNEYFHFIPHTKINNTQTTVVVVLVVRPVCRFIVGKVLFVWLGNCQIGKAMVLRVPH